MGCARGREQRADHCAGRGWKRQRARRTGPLSLARSLFPVRSLGVACLFSPLLLLLLLRAANDRPPPRLSAAGSVLLPFPWFPQSAATAHHAG